MTRGYDQSSATKNIGLGFTASATRQHRVGADAVSTDGEWPTFSVMGRAPRSGRLALPVLIGQFDPYRCVIAGFVASSKCRINSRPG